MADFTDRFSGKQYRVATFLDLSASLAAASDNTIDGRIHEEFEGKDAIAKLPFRIKQGDQAKFFPGLQDGTSDGGIETGSAIHPIRDTERQIVYVPIKKKNYQKNLIGVDSHISSTFSSNAYLQVSASFAQKFSGVSDDTIITYCVEEFYSSPSASRASAFVGQLTASYDIIESGTLSDPPPSSFSAIHSESYNRNFEFRFPTGNFITHWSFRFADGAFPAGSAISQYSSSIFLSSTFVRFDGSGSNTSSFGFTDNQFIEPSSGSRIARGMTRNINGTNTADGTYTQYIFKGTLKGDADSGSLYSNTQFIGENQIIIYPPTTPANIGSASFQYNKDSRNAATGSASTITVYFYSGSGASSLADPDYGFFVTGGIPGIGNNGDLHSTPLHRNATLRLNTPEGFYSPSGSQYSSSIFVTTASGVTSGKGPVFAQLYQAGN
jgi:hypothetical protein